MHLIIAKNIGFCSGVKRAVLIAEKALKTDKKPVQFLGSLVHNEKVIEKFRKNGVKFIKNLKTAEPGTLIIQAHGIAPFPCEMFKEDKSSFQPYSFLLRKNSVLKEDKSSFQPYSFLLRKNSVLKEDKSSFRSSINLRFISIKKELIIRDATCPLVKKAQRIANSFYKQGLQVIIIGDKKHSETKGVKGYTNNTALIVANEKEAKELPNFKKIGVVSQTTQNIENVEKVLNILKKKVKEIKFTNTLCPEVQIRQKELNLLLKKVDAILVIGSKKSANTGRLSEISEKTGKPVWQMNSPTELAKINFKNIANLGIVSGTSTPNWEIDKIKQWLLKKQK